MFCAEERLVVADLELITAPNSFTHFNEAHYSVSWLDHIITSSDNFPLITSAKINYEFLTSDHFPLNFTVSMDQLCVEKIERSSVNRKSEILNWVKTDLKMKQSPTKDQLNKIALNNDLLQCTDVKYSHENHKREIDNLYHKIVGSLDIYGKQIMTENISSPRSVPGWNEYFREAHSAARDAFIIWRANNCPRNGYLFDLMKSTRAHFKLSLREAHSNKKNTEADKLANKFLSKDPKHFLSQIKCISNDSGSEAVTIDNIKGSENTAKHWHDKYEKLLNTSKTNDNNVYCRKLSHKISSEPFFVSEVKS